MSDNVHTPKHYQGRNGLEAIEVHRNFMNDEQLTGYHLGNLIKYVLRYRRKNATSAKSTDKGKSNARRIGKGMYIDWR